MTDPGYYDQSIPPALLVGRAGRASAPAPRRASPPPGGGDLQQLTVGPDGYTPAVPAAQRPRNLQELHQRTQLMEQDPWPAGAFVPIGVRGKRAHWTGVEWKGGASPGYGYREAPAGDDTTTPVLEAPAAPGDASLDDTPAMPWNDAPAFPGDEAPGDLSR